MALENFIKEIESIRNEARTEISRFQNDRTRVQNDPNLSAQGRYEQVKDGHEYVTTAVAALQKKEEAAIVRQIESTERSLTTRLGSSGTDILAMRDAEERADNLSDRDGAMTALTRAVRSDDRSLAHAIIRRASNEGWGDVVDKAAEAYPSAGEALKDLAALHQFNTGIQEGFARAGAYHVFDLPRFTR